MARWHSLNSLERLINLYKKLSAYYCLASHLDICSNVASGVEIQVLVVMSTSCPRVRYDLVHFHVSDISHRRHFATLLLYCARWSFYSLSYRWQNSSSPRQPRHHERKPIIMRRPFLIVVNTSSARWPYCTLATLLYVERQLSHCLSLLDRKFSIQHKIDTYTYYTCTLWLFCAWPWPPKKWFPGTRGN